MLGSNATFARRLLDWYDHAKRDLPWRTSSPEHTPDPYRVLVSEAMLQQTQVAAVIPYFLRFMERFPSIADLAAADEQDVLRMWQGLGYYSRARNLRKAAQAVVANHAGRLPTDVAGLLALPGVGRYTAGAIASIAFGTPAPILDGNVMRVLCRLDAITAEPRDRLTQSLLWSRAEAILPKCRVGDFNSALMELGATVCIPRSPKCLSCPVQKHCQALAAGMQDRIPPARKAKTTPLFRRRIYCVRRSDSDGTVRWRIEQRPATGRWAGMWQFVTVDADGKGAERVQSTGLRRIGEVAHALTHRRYLFDVYLDDGVATDERQSPPPTLWVSLSEIEKYPLPRPHVKVIEMLRGLQETG